MPRDGSGVYAKPASTAAVSGDPIGSAKFNTLVTDLADDNNVARPIVAGGTGATSASAARTALGLAIGTDIASQADMDAAEADIATNAAAIAVQSGFTETVAVDRAISAGDVRGTFYCTASLTITLPSAATVGTGFNFKVRTTQDARVTVTPDGSETVNGAANGGNMWGMANGEFVSDGTNWIALINHEQYEILWTPEIRNASGVVATHSSSDGIIRRTKDLCLCSFELNGVNVSGLTAGVDFMEIHGLPFANNYNAGVPRYGQIDIRDHSLSVPLRVISGSGNPGYISIEKGWESFPMFSTEIVGTSENFEGNIWLLASDWA